MDIRFFHGPQRLPVRIRAGVPEQTSGVSPFHGVVSRGLLADLNARQNGPAQWAGVSPFLELALVGHPVPDVEHLSYWTQAALRRRVLTYPQGAACAGRFVHTHASDLARRAFGMSCASERLKAAELWSVKEGHTASVWQATVSFHHPATATLRFAVHVARDADAGAELLATSSQMKRLHTLDPDGVTEVLAVDNVPLDSGGAPWSVPIVATSWADESNELHVIRDATTGFGRFAAVDRFLCAPDSPGRIQSILGTRLDSAVSDGIWAEILRRTVRYTEFADLAGPVRSTATEINEGDWVWDGHRLRLVALSDEPPSPSLGGWVLHLLLLGARADSGPAAPRLYWGNVERALEVFEAAARSQHLPIDLSLRAAAEAEDKEFGAPCGFPDERLEALRQVVRQSLRRRLTEARHVPAHGF
jgi:hypothetical protein